MRASHGYGKHLVLWACIDSRRWRILRNRSIMYKLLDEGPLIVGFTIAIKPYVFEHVGRVYQDQGLSGLVLLEQPGVHFLVHTFPRHGYLCLDFLSRKNFQFDLMTEQAWLLYRPKCSSIIKDPLQPLQEPDFSIMPFPRVSQAMIEIRENLDLEATKKYGCPA